MTSYGNGVIIYHFLEFTIAKKKKIAIFSNCFHCFNQCADEVA